MDKMECNYDIFLSRYTLENDSLKKEAIFKQYLNNVDQAFCGSDEKEILKATASISAWFGENIKIEELWDYLKARLVDVNESRIKAAVAVGCTDLIPETPINAKMLRNLFTLLIEPELYWVLVSAYEQRTELFFTHFELFVKIDDISELQDVLNSMDY